MVKGRFTSGQVLINGLLFSSSLLVSSLQWSKSSYTVGKSSEDPVTLLVELLLKEISACIPLSSTAFHSSQKSFQSFSGISIKPSVWNIQKKRTK